MTTLVFVGIIVILFAIAYAYYAGYDEGIKNGLKAGREHVADQLDGAHYWFSGGFDGPPKNDVLNTLFFIQYSIRKFGYFSIDAIRKKVYKLNGTPYHKLPEEELKNYLI